MAGASRDVQGRETAAAIPFARTADPADPFGMAEWMRSMPNVALHPLMAHPTAAIAAAAALGFGLSSQIAGIMFGAMQGAASAMQKSVAAPEVEPVEATKRAPAVAPQAAARQASEAPSVPAARKPRAARKPAASAQKSGASDDLKRISGIGPKLEQVLNGRGIRRFADIAALSEADVAKLDAEFGLNGRITRDDWIGQAKALKGVRKK
ncbi:NADH-quinone oxidoreductase subunit E [Ensifer sp. WSM1721]|uniref:NADH:ubiquinone oxidoreductase n=1 Tax=Ensifer sp. WSM1721 TaxID=1041159 RepID=UPI00047C5FE0|nr:NADH:ubiquinone oxidoreductase [Ensifer sp. WSM1721]